MESFVRLVFAVRERTLRGFAAGWGTGQGWSREEIARRMIWPDDWHVEGESMLHDIVEALTPGQDSVLLMRTDIVDSFLKALQPWESRLAVSLESRQTILSASMEFAFKFYSRDEANLVRSILKLCQRACRSRRTTTRRSMAMLPRRVMRCTLPHMTMSFRQAVPCKAMCVVYCK